MCLILFHEIVELKRLVFPVVYWLHLISRLSVRFHYYDVSVSNANIILKIFQCFCKYSVKSGHVIPPPLFLKADFCNLFEESFVIPHKYYDYLLWILLESAMSILIEIVLRLWITLDSMFVIILSVHKHRISFNLVVSLVTFITIL